MIRQAALQHKGGLLYIGKRRICAQKNRITEHWAAERINLRNIIYSKIINIT